MKYILQILVLITLFSCNQTANKEDIEELVETESNQPVQLSLNDAIRHLDSIVQDYQISDKHSFPYDSVYTKPSLLKLRSESLDTLKQLLTILMIKKYRYHIECCRQGYELRNQKHIHSIGLDTIHNPLLYEFLRFSHSYDHIGYSIDSLLVKNFEFMNSGIIMNWLEKHPKYLEDKRIIEHYDFIKQIEEKGDYW